MLAALAPKEAKFPFSNFQINFKFQIPIFRLLSKPCPKGVPKDPKIWKSKL
jgi:hypothetical protein